MNDTHQDMMAYEFCKTKDIERLHKWCIYVSAENRSKSLKYVCKAGLLDSVKFFVEHGADVTYDRNWAVIFACMNNHLEIAEYLVKHGANVQDEDNLAFKLSCTQGHLKIIQFLIENGVNPSVHNNFGLLTAVKDGNFEVVKYLVQKGAKASKPGNQPLCNATWLGHYDIVKFLLENGAKNENLGSSLKVAVDFNFFEIFKLLVENGANISYEGDYSFRIATQSGFHKIVKLLIEKGYKIRPYDWELGNAIRNGHFETVKVLVEHISKQSFAEYSSKPWQWHDTPLNVACERGYFKIVRYLLKQNIGDVSHFNSSSLHYLCQYKVYDIVDRFLDHEKCDLNEFNNYYDKSLKKFLQKRQEKRIWAANTIRNWWIPICYDTKRESGKKMVEKEWLKLESLYISS